MEKINFQENKIFDSAPSKYKFSIGQTLETNPIFESKNLTIFQQPIKNYPQANIFLFCYQKDGEILGYNIIEYFPIGGAFGQNYGKIEAENAYLFVENEYRKKGIGNILYKAAQDFLTQKGVKFFRVFTKSQSVKNMIGKNFEYKGKNRRGYDIFLMQLNK